MIGAFLCIAILHSLFGVAVADAWSCWHGGIMDNSTGWCDCPYGWENDPIPPGRCALRTCRNGTGPDSEGNCLCSTDTSGWGGINCEMCETNEACQNWLDPTGSQNASGTVIECRKSLVSSGRLTMQCNPDDPFFYFTFGNMTIQCYDVGLDIPAEAGYCIMESFNVGDQQPTEEPQLGPNNRTESYWCHFSQCSMELLTGSRVQTSCLKTHCECNFDLDLNSGGNDACSTGVVPALIPLMENEGRITCNTETNECIFWHDDMDDQSFTMECFGRECVVDPEPIVFPVDYVLISTVSFVGVSIGVCVFLIVLCLVIDLVLVRKRKPSEDALKAAAKCGAKLEVRNLNYYVHVTLSRSRLEQSLRDGMGDPDVVPLDDCCCYAEKRILKDVSFVIEPGQVVAVMGATGAGKTTLLDLCSQRSKDGQMTGSILFNDREIMVGEKVSQAWLRNSSMVRSLKSLFWKVDPTFQRTSGYVYQDGCFLPSATVRETIRFAADLRLPGSVSRQQRQELVDDVIRTLGLSAVADRRVGDPLNPRLSGGERKRVAIATELVVNPHVLFLDEPTSGLDSSTSLGLVNALVSLARRDMRTIVFSIHQPRRKIFERTDVLILLHLGNLVYAGPSKDAIDFFVNKGFKRPDLTENPADWLMDVVASSGEMEGESGKKKKRKKHKKNREKVVEVGVRQKTCSRSEPKEDSESDEDVEEVEYYDDSEEEEEEEEEGEFDPRGSTEEVEEIVYIEEVETASASADHEEDGGDCDSGSSSSSSSLEEDEVELAEVDGNDVVKLTSSEVGQLRHVFDKERLSAYAVPFYVQLYHLGKRTGLQLLRNFNLVPLHYGSSLILGLLLGLLYYQSEDDLPGSQNRIGVIFFICMFFNLTAMSGLEVFIREREIYVRERANAFYRPIAYFLIKALFDLVPLRVIPPIILCVPAYFMIGMRTDPWPSFFVFVGWMILFNFVSGALIIMIGVLSKSVGTANILTTILILIGSVFSGFLLNLSSMPSYISWMRYLSYWSFAFESLLVVEFSEAEFYVVVTGIRSDVGGTALLTELGMSSSSVVWNIYALAAWGVFFLLVSMVALQLRKEKR